MPTSSPEIQKSEENPAEAPGVLDVVHEPKADDTRAEAIETKKETSVAPEILIQQEEESKRAEKITKIKELIKTKEDSIKKFGELQEEINNPNLNIELRRARIKDIAAAVDSRRLAAKEIMKYCHKILGTSEENIKKEEREIEAENKRQFELPDWKKTSEANEKWYGDRFVTSGELENQYNEIIRQSNLSEKQKTALLKPELGEEPEIFVGGVLRGIHINKEDVAIALKNKWDFNKIKRAGLFTDKISVGKTGQVDGDIYKDIYEFQERIKKERNNIIHEVAQKRAAEREDLIVGRNKDLLIDSKIKELVAAVNEKVAAEKEEKKRKESEAKIEAAKNIPDAEREKLLKVLKGQWTDAVKIHRGIKANKNESKKQKLEEAKNDISDSIVNIADELTGRKLRGEAAKKAKENGREEMDLDWLTLEVQKIFKEQIVLLPKKVKPSAPKGEVNLTPSPTPEPAPEADKPIEKEDVPEDPKKIKSMEKYYGKKVFGRNADPGWVFERATSWIETGYHGDDEKEINKRKYFAIISNPDGRHDQIPIELFEKKQNEGRLAIQNAGGLQSDNPAEKPRVKAGKRLKRL